MNINLMLFVPVVIAIVVILVGIKSCWRVPRANEALIITGGRGTSGMRVLAGHGGLVWPVVNRVGSLDIGYHEATLDTTCPTKQGIQMQVGGVAVWRVADDTASIINAARRFMGANPALMSANITKLLDGHLRSIIGGLEVEEIIHERDTVTRETREAAGIDAAKLGLSIDTLQLQNIGGDAAAYIQQLAVPNIAAVQSAARIAAAEADQAATQAEQTTAANKAQYQRDTQVKTAQYQADVDTQKAQTAQAGPLADALAKQKVVQAATETAQLFAAQKEQELYATVRKPAEADAFAVATRAAGERDAIKAKADADAYVTQVTGQAAGLAAQQRGEGEAAGIKAKLVAEADGKKAMADALAVNQDAVIAQMIAERAPEIVKSAASIYDKVGNMVVLNGAEGIQEGIQGLITVGLAVLPQVTSLIKKQLPQPNGAATMPVHD